MFVVMLSVLGFGGAVAQKGCHEGGTATQLQENEKRPETGQCRANRAVGPQRNEVAMALFESGDARNRAIYADEDDIGSSPNAGRVGRVHKTRFRRMFNWPMPGTEGCFSTKSHFPPTTYRWRKRIRVPLDSGVSANGSHQGPSQIGGSGQRGSGAENGCGTNGIWRGPPR